MQHYIHCDPTRGGCGHQILAATSADGDASAVPLLIDATCPNCGRIWQTQTRLEGAEYRGPAGNKP